MLGIALLIGIGSVFYRFADKNNLNKILWMILGVASYFIAQFIAGLVIGLTNPSLLQETITVVVISLITGLIGAVITWFIMQNVAKNKKNNSIDINDELLDNTL